MRGGASTIDIRLLGPFTVSVGGRSLPLTSSRQRALLGTLALSAGRLVSIDALARAVWGEEPPERIRGSLQTYVMRLRKHLGDEAVVTEQDGYRLDIDPSVVDALRFLRLLDSAAEQGDTVKERELLGEALQLWAGSPLEGVGSAVIVEDWAPLLTERYLFAVERRIDLDADVAPDSDLAAELTDLVAQHPLRESLWERLVRVLARSGRRAEALARYAKLRELLADELGVEPGARLRRLHAELLNADSEPAPAPQVAEVPRQLPFDVASFTGRDAELAQLDRFLADRQGRSTAIAVIEGTAGVGKTSLAVHWAHLVRDQFPDGQLFLDLRGHSAATPMTPDAALARILRAVGVAAETIPSTVEERSAMLRSRLAEARMLMLLDNAHDANQVRPLLPGSGNLVVVTSRNQLRGLVAREGAHRLPLRSFDTADATALLAGSVGYERLQAEPDAVAELAELCGRLPLALALAGERASRFSELSIAGIVDELRDQRVRLDTLRDPQDAGTDLRAAFSWSYNALRPAAARMFRLLGLHPAMDIGLPAAAVLGGTSVREARELLDQLASAHLINQPRTDRYQFHDLLRVYAAELSEQEDDATESEVAMRRLLDWYLCALAEANQLVRPDLVADGVVLPVSTGPKMSFSDHAETIDWYVTERPTLVALVSEAAQRGWSASAWKLAWLLRGLFAERHDIDDWIVSAEVAVRSVREAGDLLGLQYAANNLGSAYLRAARTDTALEALEEGRKAAADSGGSVVTAAILSNLAGAYYQRKEYEKAYRYGTESVLIARERGQKTYVAHALLNISANCIGLERFEEAAEHARGAFEAFDSLSDRYHAALSLGNVGEALAGAGKNDEAIETCVRALSLLRELDGGGGGADYGTIDILITLGRVLVQTGELTEGAEKWAEALAVCQRLGDPRTEDLLSLLASLPPAV
ncbi:BTAD domain-containing putative transcriptional regulator [Amycolatopsis sp. NPDC059657]|uniref:AfsR/SARP family transcriptional regulator n=1 Tax=Amycolatopsis sp. NPDC059657 TaxID=3346899 RepID=UPI00366E7A23